MGIKRKLFLGFSIIGLVLFISGVVSFFQLFEMERSISGILTNNLKSVNISISMIEAVERQNWGVVKLTSGDREEGTAILEQSVAAMDSFIVEARKNMTEVGEDKIVDSIDQVYSVFKQKLSELSNITEDIDRTQMQMIFNDFRGMYRSMNQIIKSLMQLNQHALSTNSQKLESGFYRMIMPSIISIGAGLFLIILFNLYMNLYLINPLLRITKGIQDYLNNRISYSVEVETEDELSELNEKVKSLIDRVKKKDTPFT